MGQGAAPQLLPDRPLDFSGIAASKPLDFSGLQPTRSSDEQHAMDQPLTERRDVGQIGAGAAAQVSSGAREAQESQAPRRNLLQEAVGTAAHSGQAILNAPIGVAKAGIDLLDWAGYGVRTEGQLGENPLQGVDAIKLLSKLPGAAKEEDIRSAMEGVSPVAKGLGAAAGNVLSFAGGAGAAGAVGKVAGAPGKLVEALGAPGYTLGKELIERFPEAARWAQMGGKNLLPATAAGSTGFGLYNLLNTEGGIQERTAAMGHGMVLGAGLHALGELGRAADAGITRLFLSPEEAKAVDDVVNGIRAEGEVNISALKKIPGRAISAALEGTGFAAMDPQWFHKVAAGLNGDKDAGMQATAEWLGSFAGTLAAHTGDPNSYLSFRRSNPERNTAALRQEATTATPSPEGSTTKGHESAPPLSLRLDPLYQSGWESHQRTTHGEGGDRTDTILTFPGHEIRIGPEGFGENQQAAEAVIGHIAHESVQARLAGEAVLGRAGFHEQGAGMPWVGDDGAHYAVGLDDKLYRQDGSGAPWEPHVAPGITDAEGKINPIPDGPLANDPAVQSWRAFMQTADKIAAPSQALRTLHAAIETAAKGSPDSPSISELMQFLKSVPPEQLEPHLTAENLGPIALEIGRLGAGTNNANRAVAEIQRLLQPSEGVIQDAEGNQGQRLRGEGEGGDGQGRQEGQSVRGVPEEHGAELQDREAAQEVDDRSGERGAVILSGGGARIGSRLKQNVKEMLEGGRHLAAQFHEQQPTELENLTKGSSAEEAGRKFAEKAREAIQGAEENDKEQQKPLREVMRTSMKTVRWLEEKVDNGNGQGGQDTRLRLLAENRLLPNGETPTAEAVLAVNRLREVLAVRGAQAVEAGVLKPSRTIPGEYEPFENKPANQISILPRLRGSGWDKVVGDADMRQQLAEDIAKGSEKLTGKKYDAAQIAENMRQAVEQKDPRVREAAYESFRELPYLPSAITDSHGRTHELLENDYLATAERLASEGARRAAIVQVSGQDFPEGAKMGGKPIREWMREFGVDRPGLKGELEALSKAGANPETVDFARNMMENIGGLARGQNWESTPVGSAVNAVLKGVNSALIPLRAANAFLLHGTDPAVAQGAYGGPVRMLTTMAKLGKDALMHPADAVASIIMEMRRLGNFMADNSSLSRDLEFGSKRRGIQAKLRKLITVPANLVRASKNILYEAEASSLVEDMKDGSAKGDKFVELDLAMAGFDRAQSQQMIEGKADQALYDRFRGQFVRGMSGEVRPGEGSALHDSSLFNKLFVMNRFWMGRANQVLRLTSQFWRRPELGFQTGTRLASLLAGSALAGNVGTWIAYQLRGLSTDDLLRELKYAPMHAVWNTIGHLFGGLPGTFMKAFAEGPGKAPEWLASLSPMSSVVAAGIDASQKMLSGELGIGEGLVRFANSIGAAQVTAIPRAADMMLGFIASPEVEEAKSRLNAWKRIEGIPIDTNNSADIPFSVTKRMVDEALRAALDSHKKDADIFDDPEIKAAMQQALGKGTGKQIAEAVMAKSPLRDITDPLLRDKLERFVGPKRMEMLYRYDQALQLIAKKYEDEAGTPKTTAENFTERMLAAGHQATLGDHQLLQNLVHEVAQREGALKLLKRPFTPEIGQLSATIYDHPEVWSDIFTPVERAALAGPGQIGTIHKILENKAMDAAVAKQDKGIDKDLENRVRKIEDAARAQGTIPAPAPGTAPRLRAPIR